MYDREYVTPVGNRGMYVLDTASWRTHRPVMDKALCINCGICLGYCPVNSIKWDEAQGLLHKLRLLQGLRHLRRRVPEKGHQHGPRGRCARWGISWC